MSKKNIGLDKMIYDLFRLGDATVWLEDFGEYEEKFAEIVKKHGFDLYKIYHGKTLEQLESEREIRRKKRLKDEQIGKKIAWKKK